MTEYITIVICCICTAIGIKVALVNNNMEFGLLLTSLGVFGILLSITTNENK